MSDRPAQPAAPRSRRVPRSGAPAASVLLTLLASVALIACSRASAESVRVTGPQTNAIAASGRVAAVEPPPVLPLPSAPAPRQIVAVPPPTIGANAAVVIDDASGAVLFDLGAHLRRPPASLTKIATAAITIDRGRLDEMVTVDIDYDEPNLDDASVMGLRRGDGFRMRDLLYGMMLPSGADAAIAIGRAVSGSDEAFVRDLNAFMVSIGLHESHFLDPHGLGGPTHLSSAYDIAMLSRYAMRQTAFADIVHQRMWEAVGSRTITVYNSNEWEFDYEGGDGVKTGYTEEAGATLSASATRAGHRVFVTILNSDSRAQDTTALMDWVFETFCWGDGQLGCIPPTSDVVGARQ